MNNLNECPVQEGKIKFTVDKIEYSEKRLYAFFKRCFDAVLSFIAIVIALIPLVIIALFVRFDSEGPVIFRQERLGKGGKTFTLYKFRTMVCDAEKNGPQWAEKGDSRCTRCGAFLRKFRLDELPQLLNILRGDMSIVGPRPERAYFYEQFSTYIDGFDQRLYVKPGLTGLAQVNGGYELKPEEKIIYDMEYIQKRSLYLDFVIILKTVRTVLFKCGAR